MVTEPSRAARPVRPRRCLISVNITAVACQITPKALCSAAQGCGATLGPWSDEVSTLKGLRPPASVERNPFGVEKRMPRLPRVAAARQP